MSNTIRLNIPADTATRVRRSMVGKLLKDLVSHEINMEQATTALVDLISVEIAHSTGRTKAGNDIGGI